jgi:hypothetical protein
MINWTSLVELHDFFEKVNHELNTKLCNTQNEILRLQKIVDSFNPSASFLDAQTKKPSFNSIHSSADAYSVFQTNLDTFYKLPKLSRERIAQPFLNRMMDFCRPTAAHFQERMVKCCDTLIHEFKMADKARTSFLAEATEDLHQKYQNLINSHQLFKKVDPIGGKHLPKLGKTEISL